MQYQPKRSTARWLEGAPRHVLACYDNGGKSADRYTILYGAPLWDPSYGRDVPARAASASPFHPQGVGLYVQVPAWNRNAYGRKIKWADLPEDVRKLTIQDGDES